MIDRPAAVPARLSLSVAALLLAANDALGARLGAVTVRGEVSGFSRAASGHCYFSLKDADGAPALLRCAMFRRAAGMLQFAPADGQQVEVRGRLGIYESRGELQMVVEALQRLGVGTLYEEFLRRRATLEAQGVFDALRKRPLPVFPRTLGIVTSLAAAALHDVLTTLARRAPQVRVVVYPAPVQGVDAPALLAQALRLAGERREVDAVLLVRGGGSLEDLWAFNDERVVHAVAACALPVICGVGHETDITLCDLAADLRAPTPTAAAELAAPSRDDLQGLLQARRAALQRLVERALEAQNQGLDTLAIRLGQPARLLVSQAARLTEMAARMRRILQVRRARAVEDLPRVATRLSRALVVQRQQFSQRMDAAEQRLRAHDPRAVLKRGYAWVESADGRPVVTALGLGIGQPIRAVWADGRVGAIVTEIEALPPVT